MALDHEPLPRSRRSGFLAGHLDGGYAMALEKEELPDRVAIGHDHYSQQNRVPEREAVERRRDLSRRVHRQRIAQRLRQYSLAEMRAHQNDDQQGRRD